MSVPAKLECWNCRREEDPPAGLDPGWALICPACGGTDWRDVPMAAAVVNGHRVVLDEDGLYYLWSPGVGFWGFGFKDIEGAIAAAEGVD